jgi:hypothetical protein
MSKLVLAPCRPRSCTAARSHALPTHTHTHTHKHTHASTHARTHARTHPSEDVARAIAAGRYLRREIGAGRPAGISYVIAANRPDHESQSRRRPTGERLASLAGRQKYVTKMLLAKMRGGSDRAASSAVAKVPRWMVRPRVESCALQRPCTPDLRADVSVAMGHEWSGSRTTWTRPCRPDEHQSLLILLRPPPPPPPGKSKCISYA